jgi:two-component system NtrC family sensor kinase
VRGKSGETIWIRLNGTRIDYQDRPALLINATDVTQEKRLQERLVRTEKLRAIADLVGGAAHELNYPLAAIVGYAELAQAAALEGELAEYVQQILRQSMRASTIVRQLLTFARQEEPKRAPVSPNAVVRGALDLRHHNLRRSNIEVTLELEEQLPPVMGDFQQLEQVLLHLINNAEQAIRRHRGTGTITVRSSSFTARGRCWVDLEVLDDGPGIPETDLSRIFDPFFTTKGPGEAAGLGLSVAYGIVNAHEGHIFAESPPEGGARLVVELPAVRTPPPRPGLRDPASGVAPARILVVDDEQPSARMLEQLFAADGHRVTVVSDGSQALERLSTESTDLIIIDTRMPVMSAAALYYRLTQEHPHLVKRVVFVTRGVLSDETRRLVHETQAPLLAKPLDLDNVKRVVYEKLKEAQA